MRPGNPTEQHAGIAAVLDTTAECKVVHDALAEGQRPPRGDYDTTHPGGMDAWLSVNDRFFDQARIVIDRPSLPDKPYTILNETWKTNPTFEVTFDDIKFARNSAQRILGETGLMARAFNRLTRRTTAAKNIVNVLSSVKPYPPAADPPKPRPMD